MQNEQTLEMTIQHLGRGEPTINDALTREQQWNYYIQSYTMVTPTEGVDIDSENYKAPFLKRNLRNLASSLSAAASAAAAAAAATSTQPAADSTTVSDIGPSGARTPREPAANATSPATTTTNTLSAAAAAAAATTQNQQHLAQVAEGCLVSRHNLELKVCVNTYKVFYTKGTEDYMLGKGWLAARDRRRERWGREKRGRKWRGWLDRETVWVKAANARGEGEGEAEVEGVKRAWREWVGGEASGPGGKRADVEAEGEGDVEMSMG